MTEFAALNERIVAPAELPTIEHADIASIRPASIDDLDALVTLTHAAEDVDHPKWRSTRAEVEDLLIGPTLNSATDSLIAFDASGRAIAHTTVFPGAGVDTRVQMYVFGVVHPDVRARGIGTQFIAWGRDRALQRLAERTETLPAWILTYAQERTADAIAIAENVGLKVERYFTSMERSLDLDISHLSLGSDLEIVTFTQELADSVRIARNDSFRDHWGSQPSVPEKWNKFVTSDVFREDLSVLAVERETGRVVAFVLTSVDEDEAKRTGTRGSYIDLIGVVRDRRGQKIAPALISENLRRARADGLVTATLDVDSASPTGANTLYEGMGFTAGDVDVSLVLEV